MRTALSVIVIAMGLGLAAPSEAQVSLGIGIRGSGVSIGLNLSSYPEMVRVPGYPSYYAPQANGNYFFYDGLYWVFEDDSWYASSWYNGPWDLIERDSVPLFILRIPVRYYRKPPAFFRGWRADAPPRWDEYWGRDWSSRHGNWDQWDRSAMPPLAPLPSYQREYSGSRYPRAPEQRHSIRSDSYRYAPRESMTQQYWQREQRSTRESRPAPQASPPPLRQQLPQPQPQQQPQRQFQQERRTPTPQSEQRFEQRPVQRPEQRFEQRPVQRPEQAPQGVQPQQREQPRQQQSKGSDKSDEAPEDRKNKPSGRVQERDDKQDGDRGKGNAR